MGPIAEIITGISVEIVIFGVGLALLYRILGRFVAVPYRLVVPPFKTGVVLRHGKPERIVPAGSYWLLPSRTIVTCDARPAPFQLGPQEFLTGDSMGVRVTLAGEYLISDPAAFITTNANSATAFLLELKQAVRTAVAELSGHTFLTTQHGLPARIRELLLPRATQLGITLTLLDLSEAIPLGWLKSALPTNPQQPPPNMPYGPN